MSIQAYQRAATQGEDPRDLEYRAFAKVTAQLTRVKELGRVDIGALAEAVYENRRLWTILTADCAHDGNALSDDARAQIISLGLFVDRYSGQVLREGAELDPLIDINRTVMEGLRARAGEAAPAG